MKASDLFIKCLEHEGIGGIPYTYSDMVYKKTLIIDTSTNE